MTIDDMKRVIQIVQGAYTDLMQNDTHYGTIPGTNKPTLLQPGAQMLALIFRLATDFDIERTDAEGGHREYTTRCRVTDMETGELRATGVGTCSTLESKYRYRNESDYEITGDPIPEDARDRKREYRAKGLGMKKINGQWEWVRYSDSVRVENPDIADMYNTVLKMSCKRAFIHGIIIATGCSDMFAQDVEDFVNVPDAPRAGAASLARIQNLIVSLGYSVDDAKASMEKTVKARYGHDRAYKLTDVEADEMIAGLEAKVVERKKADEGIDPAEEYGATGEEVSW